MENGIYGTDNGPQCRACHGTVYQYRVIGTFASAFCVGCARRDADLRIPLGTQTAADLSAYHRHVINLPDAVDSEITRAWVTLNGVVDHMGSVREIHPAMRLRVRNRIADMQRALTAIDVALIELPGTED